MDGCPGCGAEDQLADSLVVGQRGGERDAAAQGAAGEVGLAELEPFHEADHHAGQEDERRAAALVALVNLHPSIAPYRDAQPASVTDADVDESYAQLDSRRVRTMWKACEAMRRICIPLVGCTLGIPEAVRMFEAMLETDMAVSHDRMAREKLRVGGAGSAPRIAEYAGRGALRPGLLCLLGYGRVTAVSILDLALDQAHLSTRRHRAPKH